MASIIDFTVAICTYNGAKRIPTVLDYLSNQINLEQINWEILIIDNNSTDHTAVIIQQYQQNSPLAHRLHYHLEKQQGVGYARQTAIRLAKSNIIGFLDDDNLPFPNWIYHAHQFTKQHPQAGAIASSIHGLFETEPPPNLKPLLPFLAITELGNKPFLYNTYQKNILPPSAGLVVRKSVWLTNVPPNQILNGRTKDNFLTGEDLETLSYIKKSGSQIWYNPAMEIWHKIPSDRLQKKYLIPFFRGIGLSRHVTRMIPWPKIIRPLIWLVYLINDITKILISLCKHGIHSQLELSISCQRSLIIGSLLSPFYLWTHQYYKKPT